VYAAEVFDSIPEANRALLDMCMRPHCVVRFAVSTQQAFGLHNLAWIQWKASKGKVKASQRTGLR